jgi:hypothetical protein
MSPLSHQNSASPRNADEDPMLPRSLVFEFLNQMPLTINSVSWITHFREALLLLFPGISQVTISINIRCDLVNPAEYRVDAAIVEHVTGGIGAESMVTVRSIELNETPSERLVTDFRINSDLITGHRATTFN